MGARLALQISKLTKYAIEREVWEAQWKMSEHDEIGVANASWVKDLKESLKEYKMDTEDNIRCIIEGTKEVDEIVIRWKQTIEMRSRIDIRLDVVKKTKTLGW